MLTLEKVTEEYLYIIREIVNSNSVYNELENGKAKRTDEELCEEFFHGDAKRHTYFVKADDTYVGLVEYMECNERDGYPWLGLLMIHRDYQGYGYGTNAYFTLEEELKEKGITKIRLAVIEQHEKAKAFWESLGFSFFAKKESTKGIMVDCYEKTIMGEL
jgi:RimJ/RimL family protein N-acetyltransferase